MFFSEERNQKTLAILYFPYPREGDRMTYLSPDRQGDDAERLAPWGQGPGRLWSLWDMIRFAAEACFRIGMEVKHVETVLNLLQIEIGGSGIVAPHLHITRLSDRQLADLCDALGQLNQLCKRLDLPVTARLLDFEANEFPRTKGEFALIVRSFRAELETKTFLHVPQERAHYYGQNLPAELLVAFPHAASEIVAGGDAFACGLYTASVFHAMRAAERGVRALASELDVTFPFSLELAEWHNLLDQIDSKIKALKNLPKGDAKESSLQFYSEAAAQFRYFKDAWRVRVAHARAVYEERQSREVIDHTISFFLTLSSRLKEATA
jgi:hypothetical protein